MNYIIKWMKFKHNYKPKTKLINMINEENYFFSQKNSLL